MARQECTDMDTLIVKGGVRDYTRERGLAEDAPEPLAGQRQAGSRRKRLPWHMPEWMRMLALRVPPRPPTAAQAATAADAAARTQRESEDEQLQFRWRLDPGHTWVLYHVRDDEMEW
eukprot:1054235-Amphidinium_carterae.1